MACPEPCTCCRPGAVVGTESAESNNAGHTLFRIHGQLLEYKIVYLQLFPGAQWTGLQMHETHPMYPLCGQIYECTRTGPTQGFK